MSPSRVRSGGSSSTTVESQSVQLPAEPPRAHRGCQIRAGRGDDRYVYRLVASAAEPAHLTRLDRGQELHLQGVGQLSDLVEEQRPVMRRLDQPLLGCPRVGERSRS